MSGGPNWFSDAHLPSGSREAIRTTGVVNGKFETARWREWLAFFSASPRLFELLDCDWDYVYTRGKVSGFINVSRFIAFGVFGFVGVYTIEGYSDSQLFTHIHESGEIHYDLRRINIRIHWRFKSIRIQSIHFGFQIQNPRTRDHKPGQFYPGFVHLLDFLKALSIVVVRRPVSLKEDDLWQVYTPVCKQQNESGAKTSRIRHESRKNLFCKRSLRSRLQNGFVKKIETARCTELLKNETARPVKFD